MNLEPHLFVGWKESVQCVRWLLFVIPSNWIDISFKTCAMTFQTVTFFSHMIFPITVTWWWQISSLVNTYNVAVCFYFLSASDQSGFSHWFPPILRARCKFLITCCCEQSQGCKQVAITMLSTQKPSSTTAIDIYRKISQDKHLQQNNSSAFDETNDATCKRWNWKRESKEINK